MTQTNWVDAWQIPRLGNGAASAGKSQSWRDQMVAPTSNIGLQSAHKLMQCDSVEQEGTISAIHVLEQWPRLSFYVGEGVSNLASDSNENLFIYVSIYLLVYMTVHGLPLYRLFL